MNTIYSTTGFEVEHDTTDDEQPILLTLDDNYKWLEPQEALDAVHAIVTALRPGVAPAISDSLNRDLIAVAIAHDRPIRFRYAKGTDERTIEQRSLKPEKLAQVGKSTPHDVVQGYDTDRDDFRMYRLDRIKGKVAIG